MRARQRLRRWSIPGLAALTIYLVSTDPLHLVVGFCLLTAAAVDLWMTRAHIGAERVRVRVMARRAYLDG